MNKNHRKESLNEAVVEPSHLSCMGSVEIMTKIIVQTMKDAGTPDSIPSLGEATTASSDTEEAGVRNGISRVLFPSMLQKKKFENLKTRRKAVPIQHDERESFFDSDQSILGSDHSVSFLDLAVKASSMSGRQEKHGIPVGGNLVRTNSDSKLSDVDGQGGEEGTTMQQPTPDKFSRLTGPLSDSQLASIFSMCDGGEGIVWSRPSNDANKRPAAEKHSTKNVRIQEPVKESNSGISWMPRAQSLARECATLKEIIRVDSANILQLRQGLDRLRHINKDQVDQIEQLRVQLLESRNQVERDNEARRLIDEEYQGTISLLTDELNDVKAKQDLFKESQVNDMFIAEMEQLKFENELFAAQVVKNENDLRALKQSLNDFETENGNLKVELTKLEAALGEAKASKEKPVGELYPIDQLFKQVAIISARFEVGERERKMAASAFEEKLQQKDEEIEFIRGILSGEHEGAQRQQVSVVPINKLEPTHGGNARSSETQSGKLEASQREIYPEQKSECGAWRVISDCFPG